MNENLKMSAALLSRFDLVFILLDNPDEMLDKRVSDHIIAVSSCQPYSLFTYHQFIVQISKGLNSLVILVDWEIWNHQNDCV